MSNPDYFDNLFANTRAKGKDVEDYEEDFEDDEVEDDEE